MCNDVSCVARSLFGTVSLGSVFWCWSRLFVNQSVCLVCLVVMLSRLCMRFHSFSVHWYKRWGFHFCVEGDMYFFLSEMVVKLSIFSFVLYRPFHHSELTLLLQYRNSHVFVSVIRNFADDVYPNFRFRQDFGHIIDLNSQKLK